MRIQIENDGHLCLDMFDLLDDCRDIPVGRLEPRHFKIDARIAAWYAWQTGRKTVFEDLTVYQNLYFRAAWCPTESMRAAQLAREVDQGILADMPSGVSKSRI